MRRSLLVVLMLAFALTLSGITTPVFAVEPLKGGPHPIDNPPPPPEVPEVPEGDVYEGYDKESVLEIQSWELWVKIDTEEDTWSLKWRVNGYWPCTSIQYLNAQPYSYIKVWDDKGFSWSWGPLVIPAHSLSGELTLDYHNSYTWTYTEVRWAYNIGAGFSNVLITCRVDLYVDI